MRCVGGPTREPEAEGLGRLEVVLLAHAGHHLLEQDVDRGALPRLREGLLRLLALFQVDLLHDGEHLVALLVLLVLALPFVGGRALLHEGLLLLVLQLDDEALDGGLVLEAHVRLLEDVALYLRSEIVVVEVLVVRVAAEPELLVVDLRSLG